MFSFRLWIFLLVSRKRCWSKNTSEHEKRNPSPLPSLLSTVPELIGIRLFRDRNLLSTPNNTLLRATFSQDQDCIFKLIQYICEIFGRWTKAKFCDMRRNFKIYLWLNEIIINPRTYKRGWLLKGQGAGEGRGRGNTGAQWWTPKYN